MFSAIVSLRNVPSRRTMDQSPTRAFFPHYTRFCNRTHRELALPGPPRNCYYLPPVDIQTGSPSARKEALLLMRSSAGVTARALIMLACVVGIPAFALSGTSWSQIVKKVREFQWPAILDPASASVSDPAGPPPGRGPVELTQATAPGRLCQPPATASLLPAQTAAPRPSAVVPAGYQTPAEAAPIALGVDGLNGENAGSAIPSSSDPFHSIQDRLRQLGAKYYLLESWGAEQQMYRFFCKMAIGGSADYTRCFESTGADPLQAMREVLRQVETWKEGGGRKADG
jgi:hypothetical protein